MNEPYPIEEDGDEIFTPIPKHKPCPVFGCNGGNIERRRGHAGGWWWMCANSHSYGEAE